MPSELLSALKREHRVFGRIVVGLERRLWSDEEQARPSVLSGLRVLLLALSEHEKLEEEVTSAVLRGDCELDRRLERTIELQHDAIEGLCKDIRVLLDHPQSYSLDHLRVLVGLLVNSLREHFKIEETRLWPKLRKDAEAPARAIGVAALSRVEKLERIVAADL